MTFTEKLNSLMTLTETSNSTLAKVLCMDRSAISRFRTGARGTPKNPVIRQISAALASRCGGDYRRAALYELTGDPRLNQQLDGKLLAEVIFSWLVSETSAVADGAPRSQVGRFIKSIELYSPEQPGQTAADGEELYMPDDKTFTMYAGNAGKRQAASDLMRIITASEEPCTVKIFTDENMNWLIEDDEFSHAVADAVNAISQKHRIIRVQPPVTELEYSLRSVERWLPAYMTGAVNQYYYPYARDEMHRRTLFVVPGKVVLSSYSTANQRESAVTMLTSEPSIVNAFDEQFDNILSRCRRTMIVYTREELPETDACLTKLALVKKRSIFKSSSLSVSTFPEELLRKVSGCGVVGMRLASDYRQRAELRDKILETNVVTDVMYLRPASEVLNGKAKIVGSGLLPQGPIYYTPALYVAHLENILRYMDKTLNYQVILTSDPYWNDVVIYSKEGSSTLLVKESDPTAIFEVTEQSMSDSLWDYLKRLADTQMRIGSRQATKAHLREELSRIRNSPKNIDIPE